MKAILNKMQCLILMTTMIKNCVKKDLMNFNSKSFFSYKLMKIKKQFFFNKNCFLINLFFKLIYLLLSFKK